MTPVIVPIVEGHSEVESIPILMRRLQNSLEAFGLEISRPIRVKRHQIVRAGELERAVDLAARQEDCRAVVIVLDADDDCPAELAPRLLQRAVAARSDVECRVILARSELESWFVASIESLRGTIGIADDATAPEDPERIRGAKEWLERHMDNHSYVETDDQPTLTARFDLDRARQRSPSFDKFWRDMESILRHSPEKPSRHGL